MADLNDKIEECARVVVAKLNLTASVSYNYSNS
jgi:hypothetical protein